MDSNIKKWLSNFKSENKKRKLDDDSLIKELYYYSVQTIIKVVKQNKVKNNTLELFLEGLKFIYTHTNKKYIKNKSTDVILLINATTSISIKLIDKILEDYNNTPNFNLLKYLINKKKNIIYQKQRDTLKKLILI